MLTSVNSAAQARPLEAALAVLRRDGPAQLTMRNVAAEAGVTATAIYRHFESKEALLTAVHREVYAVFRRSLVGDVRGRTAGDLVHLAFDRYIAFGMEHPNYYRYLFMDLHGVRIDRYPEDLRTARSPTFRQLRDIVTAAMEGGALAPGDPTDVAFTLYVHLHGLVALHLTGRFGGRDRTFRAFAKHSLDAILTGLGAA
jgi:AcrR family transcriptional regulator